MVAPALSLRGVQGLLAHVHGPASQRSAARRGIPDCLGETAGLRLRDKERLPARPGTPYGYPAPRASW
ncbi:hypothetical protein WJ438_36635 [Streptomyces sp. GD-15H]|uniref:hypothetical protein n=1 Tax=Streptomyces sp. GD-15H TaxID=3129112 RepID=UPI003247960B